jgi:hypothetical protein
MPRILTLLALLLCTSTALPAQSTPRHWGIDVTLSRDAFTGASTDGAGLEVSPNPRVAYELGVSRLGPTWGLRLGVGFAGGGLRGKTSTVRIDDNTTSVDRYRATLLLERTLARGDRLRLAAALGPTIDRWESAGINNRTVVGGRGGLHLGIVLGRISMEEMVLVGWSGSPFTEAAVAPTGEIKSLWTWSVGAGLRLGL